MTVAAYHEAGHVVARMFTGQELTHTVSVSIIPNDTSTARETTEQCQTEAMIETCSKEMMESTGRQLLICLLAGRGALACLLGEDSREYILHSDPEEWQIEGSDLFRADRVARIMAGNTGSPWRILEQAEEWTTDMIDMPVVWKAIERLAGRLARKGTVKREEVMKICDKVMLMGATLPKWKERLFKGYVPLASLLPK